MNDAQWFLALLGITNVIFLGIIFYFFRRDSNDCAESWKAQSNVLIQVVKETTVAITALVGEVRNRDRLLEEHIIKKQK